MKRTLSIKKEEVNDNMSLIKPTAAGLQSVDGMVKSRSSTD